MASCTDRLSLVEFNWEVTRPNKHALLYPKQASLNEYANPVLAENDGVAVDGVVEDAVLSDDDDLLDCEGLDGVPLVEVASKKRLGSADAACCIAGWM